jgi:uncharacterized protein (TIGR02453 family)
MSDFAGFPKETVRFLADLSSNNSKSWFDAHRDDYEAYWVEPAKQFVDACGAALPEIAPQVEAQPRVNGSIFRVNRDVRFSKDKSPYKDHLDFWFWEGERRQAVSGFYMRITPTHLGIGAGAHGFDRDRLAAFRNAVVDPKAGAGLVAAVQSVEKAGWPVKGKKYKQLPRGFEAADENHERFLRYGALWCGEDVPIPPSLHNRRLVPYMMNRWTKLEPLHRWLVDTLE